jgi:hypothetical protein
MAAARRHAESYSLSASQKQQQDEAKRLQSLMGKKALSENVDFQGSPLTADEGTEMEWFLYQRTVSRRAAEAEKAHKAVADQFRGPKTKSPASVVKSLSGACVIFEKAGNSPLEEAGRVSHNLLISVSGPNKPGSLPTALQDIVRKDKDITIKEDWNRQTSLRSCVPPIRP